MKLFAPKYYNKFKCIADKCAHSCCVGWEIDIDDTTLWKYNSLSCEYGTIIKESIENSDSAHFQLASHDRCPHLDSNGLCKIIKNIGEEYLCDICREHPRFYNFTNYGKELGIGMSCEAACDLILNSDEYDEFVEIGSASGDIETYDFDATIERKNVFEILKNESLEISKKVDLICKSYNLSNSLFNKFDIIESLEYLNSENELLLSKALYLNWNQSIAQQLSRILAYFVYRHCTEAFDYEDFCSSLSFSVFCTALISSIATEETINDVARIVSEEIEYSEDNTNRIKELFC